MLKKMGFGRAAAAPKTNTPAVGTADNAQQFLANRRELVRVAVKGTLREHGLGATWVGCEVGFATLPGQPDVLAIRLIVQEWREALLRYLPALQTAIVQAMGRMEVGVDHALYRVSWEFAPDCGCPVTQLPIPASWTAKPSAQAVPGVAKPVVAKFDLPPSELDHIQEGRDDIPSTFAATHPGFLDSAPGEAPKLHKPPVSRPLP